MIAKFKQIAHFGLFVYAVFNSGCAFDLAHVKYQPAQLDGSGSDAVQFTLVADTPIKEAPCGFSRTLRKDTRWEPIGRLKDGVVYRSRDQTLTIECSNVFEAYLVVDKQSLIGFYLPVEKGFSPLGKPIRLQVSGNP